MSSEPASWSLLHIESKLQIDSLSIRHARTLVQSFDEAELGKWAAWHEGAADWQLLEDSLQALGVVRRPKHAPVIQSSANPPPPPKPPPFTGAAQPSPMAHAQSTPSIKFVPETGVTQTNSGVLNPDIRLSKRVAKRYKVYVGTKGKMHETTTVDVSLTGLQIVDGVPPGNEGPLEVALVNAKGENLSLICSIIPDERRTRLKIVRAGKLDLLQQWLTNAAD
jgi:hypothetical protein